MTSEATRQITMGGRKGQTMSRQAYTVAYKLYRTDQVHKHSLLAKNKEDAYVQATFYDIPYITGEQPYSTWVTSVTYPNGNERSFNTHEGKPY